MSLPRKPRRVFAWTLFATGLLCLSYWTWMTGERHRFQQTESRAFEHALRSGPRPVSATQTKTQPWVRQGEVFGRLTIPRLKVSAMIIEGDDDQALRYAVGHVPGTALPGVPGNVGIAGHRDTFFRPLSKVRQGDQIVVRTLHGEFTYRVTSVKIVDPTDVDVLEPTHGQVLTLVTCYPFYFVGSAPQRFIVRAERTRTDHGSET